jgi:hypothetical protein
MRAAIQTEGEQYTDRRAANTDWKAAIQTGGRPIQTGRRQYR